MRILVFILLCGLCVDAQIASGGPFSISQTAVAGGGNSSARRSRVWQN